MAKTEFMDALKDAGIAIAGGSLLNTFVIAKIAQIQSLMANLPVVQGIDLGLVLAGTGVLWAVRKYGK